MAIADMPKCESCSLVFAAPIAGTKMVGQRGGMDGLSVEESPLSELHYNTNKYALYDTVLWAKQGAHRNFKAAANYDMEMNLYFREVFNPFKMIAMAIPITIDNGRANPYFTEMANQNGSVRNMTLEKIITGGAVVMYKGMDLRSRNSDRPYAADQCHSKTATLTWFVLQPAYISSNDANRFRTMAISSNLFPPSPVHELTLARVRDMCAVIATIQLKSDMDKAAESAASKSDNGVFLTRALQCQRINPATDVKGDAVYLNSPPENTLHDELNSGAADSKKPMKKAGGWRPKHVEELIGLVLGIVIGLLLFALVSYYFMQFMFKGYAAGAAAMDASIFSILSKRQQECAKVQIPIVLTGPQSLDLPKLPLGKAADELACATALTKAISSGVGK